MKKRDITLSSILRFGDARLESVANIVDLQDPDIFKESKDLQQALVLFQSAYQWGRSIAAPQIGIMKRMIAMNVIGLPNILINPEIIWHSKETQIVWDDCMSMPEIKVEVERWSSISVKYTTLERDVQILEHLSPDNAELLQHEIDHLEGVLMSKRMTNPAKIIAREIIPL